MQQLEFPLPKSRRLPLWLLLCASLLAGGSQRADASPPAPVQSQPAQEVGAAPLPATEEQLRALTAAIEQLAKDLAASYRDSDFPHDPMAEGLVISSFVELKNLARTSSFGRYLAEQLMGELQRQGHRVIELRKTTSIYVQERRGEYGLSRNEADIPGNVASGALLTGTYTIADGHLLVNARIMDHRTAALLASATAIFPKDSLTQALLADRVSAGRPGREEVIYLKRLEP